MQVIAIAGPAGSGKSVLADALAPLVAAVHLDLDVVAESLVQKCRREAPDLSLPDVLERTKDERYALLAAEVRRMDARERVIVSAPFTRHAGSARAWDSWLEACGRPESALLLWLNLDPDQRRSRIEARGSERDSRPAGGVGSVTAVPLPRIDHWVIDAAGPPADQVAQALRVLREAAQDVHPR